MSLKLVNTVKNNIFPNLTEEELECDSDAILPILRSLSASIHGNIIGIDGNDYKLVFLDRQNPNEARIPIGPTGMKFVACLYQKLSSNKVYVLKAEEYKDQWKYELIKFEISEELKLSAKGAGKKTLSETTGSLQLGSLCELPGERILATCSSMQNIHLCDFQKNGNQCF